MRSGALLWPPALAASVPESGRLNESQGFSLPRPCVSYDYLHFIVSLSQSVVMVLFSYTGRSALCSLKYSSMGCADISRYGPGWFPLFDDLPVKPQKAVNVIVMDNSSPLQIRPGPESPLR